MPETTDTATSIGFEPISEKQMAHHLMEYRARMIAHAVRSFKASPETAEDIFGEVCYKALKYRHRFNPTKGAISSFLYRVMTNAFIDSVRTSQKQFQSKMLYNTVSPNNDGELEFVYEASCEPQEDLDHQLLVKALDMLPSEYGVIAKAKAKGLTEAEISEVLSMPLGTVKSFMSRARNVLANSLCTVGLIRKERLGKYAYMHRNGKYEKAIQKHVRNIVHDYPTVKRKRNA